MLSLKRQADLTIGENYLERWYLIPRNALFNIYLHRFNGSDDDRALHDHPWYSVSMLLKGEMIEHLISHKRHIPFLRPVFRSAKLAHRLELIKGPATTLFITGPRIREWGFLCPNQWRHWTQFTDEKGNNIGNGCE